MKIEDRIILAEIEKQNEDVFKHIYNEYHFTLLCFAEGFVFDKEACEDIVQSVFIQLWKGASNLKHFTSIKSYLYKSVQNRCINYIRDFKVYDSHKVLYLEAIKNSNDPFFALDNDLSAEVAAALQTLPPAMLQIFKAKYLEEKKISQISNEFQVSENTIKTQLQRARKKLRQKLLETSSLHFFC